jgi:translation initiation factor 2 alpha subunit (eIF-2alpha)
MMPNGVKCIQDAFIGARKSHRAKDAKIEFYVIAAPKYSVEVSADDWKRAEDLFEKVCESVVTNITKAGGNGSYTRKK